MKFSPLYKSIIKPSLHSNTKFYGLFFAGILLSSSIYSDTIRFNSGKVQTNVTAKLTKSHVEVKFEDGKIEKFLLSEIKTIQFSPVITKNGTDKEQIQQEIETDNTEEELKSQKDDEDPETISEKYKTKSKTAVKKTLAKTKSIYRATLNKVGKILVNLGISMQNSGDRKEENSSELNPSNDEIKK